MDFSISRAVYWHLSPYSVSHIWFDSWCIRTHHSDMNFGYMECSRLSCKQHFLVRKLWTYKGVIIMHILKINASALGAQTELKLCSLFHLHCWGDISLISEDSYLHSTDWLEKVRTVQSTAPQQLVNIYFNNSWITLKRHFCTRCDSSISNVNK